MTLAPDYVSPCGSIVLYRGDCLEIMPQMADTVDAIICDLPYGTTSCKWDSAIPFVPLWVEYERLIKSNGAIALFGSQPFTSALVMSNPKMFRYDWVWEKDRATGHLDANKRPLRAHESILVFCKPLPVYHPQKTGGHPLTNRRKNGAGSLDKLLRVGLKHSDYTPSEFRFPRSVQKFAVESGTARGLHPTQKPVNLLEYLIKTYSNEGETILDNTFGSGTTAVACLSTGRKFIGIEKDETYFAAAVARIESHIVKLEGEKEYP